MVKQQNVYASLSSPSVHIRKRIKFILNVQFIFLYNETWVDKISIAYHKAVKKVAGLQVWDSNHKGCDTVKVPIFKHLLTKRMICFLHSLLNSCCNSISRFKYYFRYSSNYALALKRVFHLSYGIEDIFDNPLCALISRIQFVQNHEQRMR